MPIQHSPGPRPQSDPTWTPKQRDPGGEFRPCTIGLAFRLGIVVPPVYTLLILAASLMTIRAVEIAMIEMGYGTEQTWLGSVLRVVHVSFFVVPFAALTVLWVLFSLKLGAGHRWPRVTLTVFASIWLLFSAFSLLLGPPNFTGASEAFIRPAASSVLTYVANGLAVATTTTFITATFLRPSNRFFQSSVTHVH